jgi:hypothetical protein
MMEALRTSEMSVYYKETTQHYIPEGSISQKALIFILAAVRI